ncbi:MAG: hypothetical protein ACRCSQ_07665 [Bacteroidales bacterium]
MNMLYKKAFVAGAFLLSLSPVAAQVNVAAAMDSASILIGEQTRIHLEATQSDGEHVQFPLIGDTIVSGIEVLRLTAPDTVRLSDQRFTVKQDILITSFDSALYYMPPFTFVSGEDTLYTNSLALKVVTYDVDAESKEFFDIKPVQAAPFVLMDYYWTVMGILIILFVIIWSLYFYKRWKYRKDHPNEIAHVAPKLSPYETAVKALTELKEQKLWQQGLEKEYYTSLTDILRVYIDSRYHVNAMEMTSAEILSSIKQTDAPKEMIEKLKQVLLLSDFVKFAKLRPGYEENEMSIINAQIFVTQTREVIVIEEETKDPDQTSQS